MAAFLRRRTSSARAFYAVNLPMSLGAFVTELLSKPHGLAMVMAFAKIKSRKVQDLIVQLAENIVTMQME